MITDLAKVHGRSDDEVEAILLETQRRYTLGEAQLRGEPLWHITEDLHFSIRQLPD
jgi:hypothetical protein